MDDQSDVCRLVAALVKRLGYGATTAADALEALFHLHQRSYNVVISDYDMSGMDGYQLAEKIKCEFAGTRVIIMTGLRIPDLMERLEKSDLVDGLLLKPFTLAHFHDAIDTAINVALPDGG